MIIINTSWGLNSYMEMKRNYVFTDEDYQTILKPDVMLLFDFPGHEKFNQNKFWSPAEDRGGKIISECYKMKWHNLGSGRVQIRLPIMVAGEKSFLFEAYVKENEKTEKRKLAKLKTYAELIRRGRYVVCGSWSEAS